MGTWTLDIEISDIKGNHGYANICSITIPIPITIILPCITIFIQATVIF